VPVGGDGIGDLVGIEKKIPTEERKGGKEIWGGTRPGGSDEFLREGEKDKPKGCKKRNLAAWQRKGPDRLESFLRKRKGEKRFTQTPDKRERGTKERRGSEGEEQNRHPTWWEDQSRKVANPQASTVKHL